MAAHLDRFRIAAALCKVQQACVGITRVACLHEGVGQANRSILVTWLAIELLKPLRYFGAQLHIKGERSDAKLRVNGAEVAPDPEIPISQTSDGKHHDQRNDQCKGIYEVLRMPAPCVKLRVIHGSLLTAK